MDPIGPGKFVRNNFFIINYCVLWSDLMRSSRAGYQYSPAAKCSTGFEFSLQKTVNVVNKAYISAVKPSGFVRVFGKAVNNDGSCADGHSLTCIPQNVADGTMSLELTAGSTQLNRDTALPLGIVVEPFLSNMTSDDLAKVTDHRILIPFQQMPAEDFTVKATATAATGQVLILGPIELRIDEPFLVGCFIMEESSLSGKTSQDTPHSCLVECIGQGLRVAGVRGGEECFCFAKVKQLDLLSMDEELCDVPCKGNPSLLCGGSSAVQLYVATCEEGWIRFGDSCYREASLNSSRAAAEDSCMELGGHLFMPESEQELDFVTEIFKENTDHIFIGIRSFRHAETDKQDVITAMDLSEHVGFPPLTHNGLGVPVSALVDFATDQSTGGDPLKCVFYKMTTGLLMFEACPADTKPVCKKRIVEGFGNVGLLEEKGVAHIFDTIARNTSLESLLPLSGPGISFGSRIGLERPSLQWTFPSEVVINGLVLTTHKEHALKSLRLRTNIDLANPYDFESQPQPLHLYQDVSQPCMLDTI